MKILSSLNLVRTQDILFDAAEFQRIYRKNLFVLGDTYLTPFLSTFAVDLRTTHRKNNTHKCDTEVFVPVASLYGVVGSLSLFIRSLIGRTGKI